MSLKNVITINPQKNRMGQRRRLFGHVEFGAERPGERHTAERCDEESQKTEPLSIIPAKAEIHGIYPRGGQNDSLQVYSLSQ